MIASLPIRRFAGVVSVPCSSCTSSSMQTMVSSRRTQSAAAADATPVSDTDNAATNGGGGSGGSKTEEQVKAARTALIDAIMQRDKEIFHFKRQHELSMLRVEQNQNRVLKDQEDRGIYYEQNCNVVTFDTISVGLYSQRNTHYHTRMVQRLREFKILVTLTITSLIWAYLYYRYMFCDEMMYVAEPMIFMGSRANVVRDAKAKAEEEEERKRFVKERMGA